MTGRILYLYSRKWTITPVPTFLPFLRSLLLILFLPLVSDPGLHAQGKVGVLQFDFGEPSKPSPRKVEGTLPINFATTRTELRLPSGERVPAEVVYVLPHGNRSGATSRLRFRLASNLQEPVWTFETWFACFDSLRLHPSDQGDALRYNLDEGLKGVRAVREGPRTVRVSRELMALLRISRCRLALDLPLGSGQAARIERELPGQGGLGRPETWGWDTPGSPDWSRVFLCFPFTLRANKVPQGEDYLPAAEARRTWAAVMERHGAGLSGGWAGIHTFELEADAFLRQTEHCLAEESMGELRFESPGRPGPQDPKPRSSSLSEGLKGW